MTVQGCITYNFFIFLFFLSFFSMSKDKQKSYRPPERVIIKFERPINVTLENSPHNSSQYQM